MDEAIQSYLQENVCDKWGLSLVCASKTKKCLNLLCPSAVRDPSRIAPLPHLESRNTVCEPLIHVEDVVFVQIFWLPLLAPVPSPPESKLASLSSLVATKFAYLMFVNFPQFWGSAESKRRSRASDTVADLLPCSARGNCSVWFNVSVYKMAHIISCFIMCGAKLFLTRRTNQSISARSARWRFWKGYMYEIMHPIFRQSP